MPTREPISKPRSTSAEAPGDVPAAVPGEPGTYLLLLHNRSRRSLTVGRRGSVALAPGYFLYVGSAFGAGGLKSRVGRHARRRKRLRWHIDYLRAQMRYVGAWISPGGLRLEHDWAARLAKTQGLEAVPGLGASDCACVTHVFFTPEAPGVTFADGLGGAPRFIAARGAMPAPA